MTKKSDPPIEPQGKLKELVDALANVDRLLILTHNNPDPDSIGSALGLRHVLQHTTKVKSRLAYGGNVGRAENRAMITLLRVPIHEITAKQVARYKNVAIVDALPDAQNILAPAARSCRIVIDHHLRRAKSKEPPNCFSDFRPQYGATSTIITEYVKTNNIPLNARVATALYYGIKTDIRDLGRDKRDVDLAMMQFLFPKISLRWLWKIERTPVPREYFRYFAVAINSAVIVGDAIVSDLGGTDFPEVVAEMADFLLKVKGMRWSFCVGSKNGKLFFSARTLRRGRRAGALAARLAGRKGSAGGHDRSAGGIVEADAAPEAEAKARQELIERFLRSLGREFAAGQGLLPRDVPPPEERVDELSENEEKK
ncbi:MAG: DHH family phosphoesterase [Deltaproteobacteria bacterium]|nr:DHH family phosphoesterase [Deltaproteobacteria bacterium]